jgi:hypothetical protein
MLDKISALRKEMQLMEYALFRESFVLHAFKMAPKSE